MFMKAVWGVGFNKQEFIQKIKEKIAGTWMWAVITGPANDGFWSQILRFIWVNAFDTI